MAGSVVAMDVRMAAALEQCVDDVAAFCRAQGISRESYYKWKKRFEREGLDGLRDRSRRPKSIRNATPVEVEDAIVRARKDLAGDGKFDGPLSIADQLAADGVTPVPSRATIARILSRRGLVRPQPAKRPRSSFRRFQAARPNELWQSDWTEWHLTDADGTRRPVAIAGTLDDHSRLLVGIAAGHGDGDGELVWSVMAAAIGAYGVPMSSLTDNGLCYTTARRPGMRATAFETNLAALGCQSIASRPYHPQTCGKIERFWQTLKKWLRAREQRHGLYGTLAGLNRDLLVFAEYYNTQRGHRALGGRTPATAYAATVKARPAERPLPASTQIYRTHASTGGTVVVGPYAVFIGARFAQLAATAIREGDFIAIFAGDTLLRTLTADPTRRYQPIGRGTRIRH